MAANRHIKIDRQETIAPVHGNCMSGIIKK